MQVSIAPPVHVRWGFPSATESTESASGGFGDWLERDVSRRFGMGAENFVVPTKTEMAAFRRLVAAAGHTDVAKLQADAAALGYRVDRLSSNGRPLLALREVPAMARGWGTVIIDPSSTNDLVIEIPHPGFDRATPELGWRCFNAFHARAYVVAGASRGNRSNPSPDVPVESARSVPVDPHAPLSMEAPSTENKAFNPYKRSVGVPVYSVSDPTHARDTAFQAAHQALTGDNTVVLQLHGFDASKHHAEVAEFPADEQMVLTDGRDDGFDPPHLVASHEALQAAGFRGHIVSFEGPVGTRLTGVANVQQKDMDERGLVGRGKSAEFVHIEVDRSLRTGPQRDENLDRIVDSLYPVFGRRPAPAKS